MTQSSSLREAIVRGIEHGTGCSWEVATTGSQFVLDYAALFVSRMPGSEVEAFASEMMAWIIKAAKIGGNGPAEMPKVFAAQKAVGPIASPRGGI